MHYFQNAQNADQLKTEYRQLCKTYHPDKGGTTEQMQAINAAYEKLMAQFLSGKSVDEYGKGKFYKSREEEAEVEARVQEAIQKVAHLDGIELEIIGAWVWASGDTKTHKDALKEAGYWWMHKRGMWAFKGKASSGRGELTLEEMRERHGSERVHTRTRSLYA
ncbi:DnaJ domain-containing protein [Deinococcus peraridilitoris]|uniref:DnaJ-class molecular chaperone with C-terminal Zn finger domain protein n=1 Tax=Deinococcus peraridilitoris (strain DSM 19664 / LMG 22246 / CIP 109416 / KR-200) TaxID=937777 RepID=L0A8M8_DEIPD|nr:DnaJ domain-containing protein [Deinococcus peraridilitoris]AFZ69774.1 DnaJ-class molecular chaperone with C-terminal Zn finger domain protein [Deinococcus peraridilitoris DSM 19664]